MLCVDNNFIGVLSTRNILISGALNRGCAN